MANGILAGQGSAASPYLIEDCEDLNAIRNYPSNKYFKLTKNLDMKESAYKDGWTPIPNFMGNFNGGYFNIRNLKINENNNSGLFASLSTNAKVYAFGLIDVSIESANEAGAVCGSITGTGVQIYHVYINNGTISGRRCVGGIVGSMRSIDKCNINNCLVKADILATSDNVGGIAGEYTCTTENSSSIYDCISYSTITGGNYITANGCIGITNDLVKHDNLFYNKEIINPNYPDEYAVGYTAEEFKHKINWVETSFAETAYTNPRKAYLWTLEEGKLPKMAFMDAVYSLFKVEGTVCFYNEDTEEFEEITEDITSKTFFDRGIQDISIISSKVLRPAVLKGLEVLTLFDTSNDNSELPKVNIFFVATNENFELNYIIAEPGNQQNDFDNIRPNAIIFGKEKKETTQFSVEKYEEQCPDINNVDNTINLIDIYSDQKEEDTNELNYVVSQNAADNSGLADSPLKDSRTISIYSSNNEDYSGMELISETETSSDYKKKCNTDTSVIYNSSNATSNVLGNVYYNIYNTITVPARGINVTAEGENISRYLVSVNNGRSWLTYITSEAKWVEIDLNDIYKQGVTADKLASKTVMNSLPITYESKVKIASAIKSEAFNTTFAISDYVVNFTENDAPIVSSAYTTVDAGCVNLIGTLIDKENDDIQYRIYVKHQSSAEYIQLFPHNDGWYKQKNNYNMEHHMPISYFRNGLNTIKIETKDTRGKTAARLMTVTLAEGQPTVKLNSNNQFYANVTMDHTTKKPIRYKIQINGEQKGDGWSEWKNTPFTFDYSWSTKDVLNGLPNEIKIIVEDEMETQTFVKFSVIGDYKSLLFKDENNFYYSTDTGEILQQLDFGTVTGGVYSGVHKVYLENKTGMPMEHIKIFADPNTQEDLSRIKISKYEDPFDPQEMIDIDWVLENNATVPFYVRIDSDDNVTSYTNKVFKILANGDPIDDDLINASIKPSDYSHLLSDFDMNKAGMGLYNIKLHGINDPKGIDESAMYIFYDRVYLMDIHEITLEEFMINPIEPSKPVKDYESFMRSNPYYEEYSVHWLNDFFSEYYGDTFDNLVKDGKITYDSMLDYCQGFDGHRAWLTLDPDNKNKKFQHNWRIISI